MVKIKAHFDGEKIVLPADFHASGTGEVLVSFPDELFTPSGGTRPSIWDIINRPYTPTRTLDEALREIDEGRDGPDARERMELDSQGEQ